MNDFYTRVQDLAGVSPRTPAIVWWRGRDNLRTTGWAGLAEKASALRVGFLREASNQRLLPMFLTKSPTCVAAMVGAMGTGIPFACLNRKLRGPQISEVLAAAEAKVALIDVPGVMAIRSTWQNHPTLAETTWWLMDAHEAAGPQSDLIAGMRQDGFRLVDDPTLADAAPDVDQSSATVQPPPDPKAEGCCLFTSGSTGTPKGVRIGLDDLVARAQAEVDCFGLTPDDVLLSLLPFSFDVGLNQLLTALSVGCRIVLLNSWLPADILAASASTGVTGISGVPSIWLDMLNAGFQFETGGEHSRLRYLTLSGGDLSETDLGRLPELAPGAGIFKTYGQTEAFRATCLQPEEFKDRPLSVGRPFATTRVYVVGEDGNLCGPGEVGEVVHTGLGVMLGYLDGEDPERKLRPNPFRGSEDPSSKAVFTGDLGYLDSEGYLFLKGRRDAMLKVAGNRVYPREIQAQILSIEGVMEAAVLGIPDAELGTKIVCFAVLSEGVDLKPAIIRRRLAGLLPSYMVPAQIFLLPGLPRTASGKTDYPTLRARAVELLTGKS